MKKIPTKIKDLFLIQNFVHKDNRGLFVKTFNEESFNDIGISEEIKECFYSVSSKGVLRGMHYLEKPYDCIKLITVITGKALFAVLDIREESQTYGIFESFTLKDSKQFSLYVPTGCAVGFLSKKDNTCVSYLMSRGRRSATPIENPYPAYDKGIKYDSFGFAWPVKTPILSERDKQLPAFAK